MDREEFDRIFDEELGGMSAQIAQDPIELCRVVGRLNTLRPVRTLEIGINLGGTTRFWQLLTSELVVAVDMDTSKITVDFSGHAPPLLIQGDSTAHATVAKVREHAPYDFLWIDGGHTYEIAKSDWDNYAPMVRPGGVVGLHDVKAEAEGPYKLLKELQLKGFFHEAFIGHKGTALISIPF